MDNEKLKEENKKLKDFLRNLFDFTEEEIEDQKLLMDYSTPETQRYSTQFQYNMIIDKRNKILSDNGWYDSDEEKCECCSKGGKFQDNFCNDCIIEEYGDSSIQAKKRGIGQFKPQINN